MPMSQPPLLLQFRVSHFNEKVRWALDHKRIPHQRKSLVPGLHIPRVRLLTGQNKVPALVLDGRAIHDSSAIIAELERLHPDPPLLPADPLLRQRALALEDHFDEQVAPDMRRLFWSCYWDRPADMARMATDSFAPSVQRMVRAMIPVLRPAFRANLGLDKATLEGARQRLSRHFDRLESEIGPSGYLVGNTFTLADLTAAAVMTAILRPPQFAYPLPEPWPPALVEMKQSLAQRPGYQWVMDIYARHRGKSAEIKSPAH